MRVVTVVGARPQFVKASPVSRAFAAHGIEEVLVHTGQHYDSAMSDRFFDDMQIPKPVVNLGVGSGSHAAQTAEMLKGIESALERFVPTWVLVYGDTNSTIAAALAAAKLHIPVAHVEAGLRSFNRRMPEEINRIATDAISTLLFAPTAAAEAQLHSEGVPAGRIILAGDVMYDAAMHFQKVAARKSTILHNLGLSDKQFVLATVHRAENTDDPERLASIFEGLRQTAAQLPVVLPLHPRTKDRLRRGSVPLDIPAGLHLVDPVGYLDMIMLESHAAAVATDSGGVQKEAFFFGTPCVTLRNETEWVELVQLGWNRLCPPTSASGVSTAVLSAIGTRGTDATPYGAGDAAEKIARALVELPPGV